MIHKRAEQIEEHLNDRYLEEMRRLIAHSDTAHADLVFWKGEAERNQVMLREELAKHANMNSDRRSTLDQSVAQIAPDGTKGVSWYVHGATASTSQPT